MKSCFLDLKKTKRDSKGIWTTRMKIGADVELSKSAWEKIYDYDVNDLGRSLKDFNENKLAAHLSYIEKDYKFSKNTIYLEIGCGPGYVGQFLMKKYGCHFIGVDFNYNMLLTLKDYLSKNKLNNFTLIHADINNMPLRPESIDYIYGGGVIEHFSNTQHILDESYKFLKNSGISFNTVPAFNLWWFTRFYNNIPSISVINLLFEFIHLRIFSGYILKRYYGYELSFTPKKLRSLHKSSKFSRIEIGAFAFYPSKNVLRNNILREIYYQISKSVLTCPVYFVKAKKT